MAVIGGGNKAGPVMLSSEKQTAFDWIAIYHADWSRWNALIWDLAETAWREYGSADWYVRKLKAEGFSVEEGSGLYGGFAEHLDEVPVPGREADTDR